MSSVLEIANKEYELELAIDIINERLAQLHRENGDLSELNNLLEKVYLGDEKTIKQIITGESSDS